MGAKKEDKMQDAKTPDFNKPIDILAYFYNEFNACGCSEIEEMLSEAKRFLTWASNDISTRPNYQTLYPGSPGAFYLIAGIFDNAGMIEHGTSIRCAWIEEKGKKLLSALYRFTIEEIGEANGTAYDGCDYGN